MGLYSRLRAQGSAHSIREAQVTAILAGSRKFARFCIEIRHEQISVLAPFQGAPEQEELPIDTVRGCDELQADCTEDRKAAGLGRSRQISESRTSDSESKRQASSS